MEKRKGIKNSKFINHLELSKYLFQAEFVREPELVDVQKERGTLGGLETFPDFINYELSH